MSVEVGRERSEIRRQILSADLASLMEEAVALRHAAFGRTQSYSPKVFIPLTQLCRDVCRYCTFAQSPRAGESPYVGLDQVVEIACKGAAAGCTEALFTLGEKPELRYAAARRGLDELGYASTIDYLAEAAERVLAETGLLPHLNPGTMTAAEIASLRRVSVSQGLMLESASERLCERGGAHFGSPDKHPSVRLETIRAAGELRVPFTSGILIGIGETREERLDSLFALRDLHDRYGHLQEIIVQNFRAKPGTNMAGADEPTMDDLLWTIAAARIILGGEVSLQAPPNLSADDYPRLLEAGINDWGGISPVTIDHVNPEAPWPHLDDLRRRTEEAGYNLVARLPIYPKYLGNPSRWLDTGLVRRTLDASDAEGFARNDPWSPGVAAVAPPVTAPVRKKSDNSIAEIVSDALGGNELSGAAIEQLFSARGQNFATICEAADALRQSVNGNAVSYVVNRNINYTNICVYRCHFCAFSKGKTAETLRGAAYDIDLLEVQRRVREAWARGATEVCMQGGIHPAYTGETYLNLCRAVKEAVPQIHLHAFSPLEIRHGAQTLGLSLADYLKLLKAEGLASLPGTAAEILHDDIRAIICPDKLNTADWLEVMETAHAIGLRSTATIMFGHVESSRHWAAHLLAIRQLQQRTGGFTEFVPLPFVAKEAPLYLKGLCRRGPTFREAVLMHAIARLVLHPVIGNIQVSWVKMGREGAMRCLEAGVNDLGGTLMNESISRAAGAEHGQEFPPAEIEALIQSLGRTPRLRTTLYRDTSHERRERAFAASPLAPVVLTPPVKTGVTRGLTDRPLAS